jgi:hypothetical protein
VLISYLRLELKNYYSSVFVNKLFSNTKDNLILYLLNSFHLTTASSIYAIITQNPIEIAITILSLKFGFNQILILLILSFI